MKIKTFNEMTITIAADDFAQLMYRAKQGEIMFHQSKANEEKIVRLKRDVTALREKVERMNKAKAAAAEVEAPVDYLAMRGIGEEEAAAI